MERTLRSRESTGSMGLHHPRIVGCDHRARAGCSRPVRAWGSAEERDHVLTVPLVQLEPRSAEYETSPVAARSGITRRMKSSSRSATRPEPKSVYLAIVDGLVNVLTTLVESVEGAMGVDGALQEERRGLEPLLRAGAISGHLEAKLGRARRASPRRQAGPRGWNRGKRGDLIDGGMLQLATQVQTRRQRFQRRPGNLSHDEGRRTHPMRGAARARPLGCSSSRTSLRSPRLSMSRSSSRTAGRPTRRGAIGRSCPSRRRVRIAFRMVM